MCRHARDIFHRDPMSVSVSNVLIYCIVCRWGYIYNFFNTDSEQLNQFRRCPDVISWFWLGYNFCTSHNYCWLKTSSDMAEVPIRQIELAEILSHYAQRCSGKSFINQGYDDKWAKVCNKQRRLILEVATAKSPIQQSFTGKATSLISQHTKMGKLESRPLRLKSVL